MSARKTRTAARIRIRPGVSPNKFFIRSSDFPDVPQLSVRVAQAFGERLGKAQTDLRACRRMNVDDFDEVGMKETDQFRPLAGHGSRGSRCIAEQRHLAEEVAGFKLGKQYWIVLLVIEDD